MIEAIVIALQPPANSPSASATANPDNTNAPTEAVVVQGRFSGAGQDRYPVPIEAAVENTEAVRVKPEAIEPEPVAPSTSGFDQADTAATIANIGLFGSAFVALLALLKLIPRLRLPRLGSKVA